MMMVIRDEIVRSIMLWIDDNIDKPLKINDVAEKSGYSKWHLQRVFHEKTEQTIANYIRDKKLESAACDLVRNTDSIVDISHRYGFDSQQSFTRAFSRKYHISPGHWRRRFNDYLEGS
jgi:AraC family multidrug resistance transcriptional activator